MAIVLSRKATVLDFLRRHKLLANAWLTLMVALALWVQIFVWGTPKQPGSGGSLLPQLRHLFGITYGATLLAVELVFSALYRARKALAWVLGAGACVDVAFWVAHLAGRHFPTGAAAALTSGAGAVVLAAGVLMGRLQPVAVRERRSPSRDVTE